MTPEEHASFHRDSADAIELVHRHGIPSGYQLQYYSDELKTWRNCLTTNGIYLYRLVELPQQTAVPYDRKTWPDWRYLKTHTGNAAVLGAINESGVRVSWPSGQDTFVTWNELTKCEVSNRSNGPWQIGAIVPGR